MRVDADETSVTLSDRPVAERLLNGFMAVAGGFTTWLCLRFYDPGGDWVRANHRVCQEAFWHFVLSGGFA